jgi:hypothetical protein
MNKSGGVKWAIVVPVGRDLILWARFKTRPEANKELKYAKATLTNGTGIKIVSIAWLQRQINLGRIVVRRIDDHRITNAKGRN